MGGGDKDLADKIRNILDKSFHSKIWLVHVNKLPTTNISKEKIML